MDISVQIGTKALAGVEEKTAAAAAAGVMEIGAVRVVVGSHSACKARFCDATFLNMKDIPEYEGWCGYRWQQFEGTEEHRVELEQI